MLRNKPFSILIGVPRQSFINVLTIIISTRKVNQVKHAHSRLLILCEQVSVHRTRKLNCFTVGL